jgi:O-antigen ligase
MEITKLRSYLLDRGVAYFYALFIAGYFLLPMAAGHRRLYYILVMPAVLLLWRELARFYRGNVLSALLLVYTLYMMSTMLWTADFDPEEAASTLLYSLALMTFCHISGYLWVEQSGRMDRMAHRCTWLAGAAAVVSMAVWYLNNPFPEARLITLGVMHHQNKSACAYGVFVLLCTYYLFTERGRDNKLTYGGLAVLLLSLVVLTQSRTALVALGVALLVLIGYRALALLAVAVPASWTLVATRPEYWQYRVESLSFRPGIWQQVLADMQGHWWFGHGYLVNPEVAAYDKTFNHAHNAYLASLRDGGLVGLALLVAILAVALVWAFRLYRERGERIYLALLLFGMTCIFMDFDRLLVHPKELWLFFWLPVALIMAASPALKGTGPARYHGHSS